MEYLQDILNQILQLKGAALVGIVLMVLGYILKLVPQVPNGVIPAVVIVGGCVLNPLLSPTPQGDVAYYIRNGVTVDVLHGFLIGAAAWFVHDKVLRRFIDSKLAIFGGGETKTTTP